MPTYNDSESICASIDSLMNQTYPNWELLIVDDGSTDNTSDTIKKYKEAKDSKKQIQYYYKENSDQLNSIKFVLDKISGDYVYILHSDDLLYSKTSLEEFIEFEKSHPGYDAYTGNSMIIDVNDNEVKLSKVMKYKRTTNRLALLYLWLGRNLYIDCAFFNTNVFLKSIKESYLDWNMPYWVDLHSYPNLISVKNMDHIMFKYRIHESNYINNDVGKLNVINGELRTATRLMSYFHIPYYRYQYLLYRIFNKLGLAGMFVPIYKQQPQRGKAKVIQFIIEKRFGDTYKNNLFLYALVEFYKNLDSPKANRTLQIKIKDDEKLFLGSDVKEFNLRLQKGELPEIYYYLLDEMKNGFSAISCKKEDLYKVETITKFLCIYPHIKITQI